MNTHKMMEQMEMRTNTSPANEKSKLTCYTCQAPTFAAHQTETRPQAPTLWAKRQHFTYRDELQQCWKYRCTREMACKKHCVYRTQVKRLSTKYRE